MTTTFLVSFVRFRCSLKSSIHRKVPLVPAVAGVAIADYWIMGRGRADLWEPFEGVNWIGVVSWLTGAAVAKWGTFFVPTLMGIVVAIVVYCLGALLIKSEKLNPIYVMNLKLAQSDRKE